MLQEVCFWQGQSETCSGGHDMTLALLISAAWATEAGPELQAESLLLRENVVAAEHGRIVDEEGVLFFESGTLNRETDEIQFTGVEIELESGWFIHAEELSGKLNGEATLTGAQITACDCDCPIWSIEAMSVEVEGLESARLEGGTLVVFGGFSVPFPVVSFPLKPGKVGLGLPGIGWEQGSPRADLPVVFRLNSTTDLELRPGWWKGPLLRGEVVADGATQASWRVEWGPPFAALATVDHVQEHRHWNAAISGLWVDRKESQARAETFLDRQRSFLEQQATLGSRGVHLEGWAWQTEETDGARWQVALREPGWQKGAFFGDHGLDMGWMLGRWRSDVRARVGWVDSRGPLEASIHGDVRGLDYDFVEQAGEWGVRATAGVVANGRHGGWRHEIKIGGMAGLRQRPWGNLIPLSELDQDMSATVWGPHVESLWWGDGHVRIEGWAHLDSEGLEGWAATALYKKKQLDWRLQSWKSAGLSLHGFTMYQRGSRSETWVGLHAQGTEAESYLPLMNVGARIGIPAESVVVWPSASAMMVGEELASINASLSVESDCDCFRIGLDSGWTMDRRELTLGVALDLLPSVKKPSSWAVPSPDTGSFFQP